MDDLQEKLRGNAAATRSAEELTETMSALRDIQVARNELIRDRSKAIDLGAPADVARVDERLAELETTWARLQIEREALEPCVLREEQDEMRAGLDEPKGDGTFFLPKS